MTDRNKSGVLVVGHGSRRREANDDVREAARRIGVRGKFALVEAAFLELEAPSIAEGFARLVEQGARDVTVHPYFLSPGRHTRGDIPVEVEEAARAFPAITYRITEPLSAHRLVIDASIERIREAVANRAMSGAARSGVVYLVGAGPGDPDLLTLKARDLLASCDVVVYDYLVNPEILRHAPPAAERVYVGKVGGGRQTPQSEINEMLIDAARRGMRVVRLKGGDPFVFGRGAEEALALREANLSFEVVPGISSAVAVPAYAGIPLTHRTLAASVAIMTGTRAAGAEDKFAASLARLASADTLVILMGLGRLREIADQLVNDHERSPETPVAVIRWGTYEGQQTVVGTLRTIGDEVERANLRSPSVIVIGETVTLRENLAWFESTYASTTGEAIDATAEIVAAF